VPDGIVSIVHAAFDRLITDIDRITARFRDIWQIGSQTLIALVSDCLYLFGRTGSERVLPIDIRTCMEAKSQ
jgi:hypothetical protein